MRVADAQIHLWGRGLPAVVLPPRPPEGRRGDGDMPAALARHFGPSRMFWGTDITKMPCSWRQCVTMFTEELPWLPERDKPLVMGQAVCAWWGWKSSATTMEDHRE